MVMTMDYTNIKTTESMTNLFINSVENLICFIRRYPTIRIALRNSIKFLQSVFFQITGELAHWWVQKRIIDEVGNVGNL
jgi:hypothetical protein